MISQIVMLLLVIPFCHHSMHVLCASLTMECPVGLLQMEEVLAQRLQFAQQARLASEREREVC